MAADNDSLRIILHKDDPFPVQEFRKSLTFSVPFHDFSSANDPHSTAMDWMQSHFVKPFKLYDAPLFEFALLKIADDRYYWFKKYFHVIVDGWSTCHW